MDLVAWEWLPNALCRYALSSLWDEKQLISIIGVNGQHLHFVDSPSFYNPDEVPQTLLLRKRLHADVEAHFNLIRLINLFINDSIFQTVKVVEVSACGRSWNRETAHRGHWKVSKPSFKKSNLNYCEVKISSINVGGVEDYQVGLVHFNFISIGLINLQLIICIDVCTIFPYKVSSFGNEGRRDD